MSNSTLRDMVCAEHPRSMFQFYAMTSFIPAVDPGPTPLAGLITRLSAAEKARITITALPTEAVPLAYGVHSAAAFRLALLRDKGTLAMMRPLDLARDLEGVYLPPFHPINLIYAKRGFVLLAQLAELGLVRATVLAAPTRDDPRRLRPMGLVARLDEIAQGWVKTILQ